MVNQLENLCKERGLEVEFITNKFIEHASSLKYNRPVIKVHRIFKDCPMKVATAVVEIFTGEGYTSECTEIIERYLKEKFGPVGIKIQPQKPTTIRHANKEDRPVYKIKEKPYYDREDSYVEADISSLSVNSIKGQHKKLNQNGDLLINGQDILDLDIIVEPPVHN